jgi:hypothetical protein
VGWLAAIIGWQSALRWDASIAGVMGVVAGACFALVVVARILYRRVGRVGAARAG